jgi:hypothetical protein
MANEHPRLDGDRPWSLAEFEDATAIARGDEVNLGMRFLQRGRAEKLFVYSTDKDVAMPLVP